MAEFAPVMTSEPPMNSFWLSVFPGSFARAGAILERSAGVPSISGSMRVRELRRTMSSDGQTQRMTPGACAIQKPTALRPASVPPVCAPFINTTRSTGDDVDMQSMISRR